MNQKPTMKSFIDLYGYEYDAEREAEIIRQEEEERQKDFEKRLRNSGVPDTHWHCSIDNYEAKTEQEKKNLKLIRKCADMMKNKGLCNPVMFGNFGAGKTHLSTGLMREFMKNNAVLIDGYDVYYYPTCRFAASNDIRVEFNTAARFSSSMDQSDVLKKYTSPDLLVIDELGRSTYNQNESDIIYMIFNARYEKKKSTVLISNFGYKKFIEFLGGALVDRLKTAGIWIDFEQVQSHR